MSINFAAKVINTNYENKDNINNRCNNVRICGISSISVYYTYGGNETLCNGEPGKPGGRRSVHKNTRCSRPVYHRRDGRHPVRRNGEAGDSDVRALRPLGRVHGSVR